MHTRPGKWLAIETTVVYHAWAAQVFSAGIECRHCKIMEKDYSHDHSHNRDPPWPSGYDAWLPSVSSQVRVSAGSPSGLACSLYKCAAL